MPLPKRSPYKSSLIILAVVFLIVFVSPAFFQSFRVKIGQSVSVPAGALAAPVLELKKFLLYHKTYDDYQTLKREYDLLKSRLISAEETSRENARLTTLLGFRATLRAPTVSAQVTGRDLSNWESSLLVNKGVKDGVKKGDAVVTTLGVVGRVIDVSDTSSRVMLLTDPQFSVAGRVRSGQQSVLVSGSLNGQCRIRYAGVDSSIKPGNEVVTSLMSAAFPENILIGTVTSVHPGIEGEAGFIVKPSVSTPELEEVLIILDRTAHD